ncbi:MAG: 2-C-methyl-D-erythritol 2,4-cyclodiphosphate synthase [Gemmatimonadota bacterium]
MIGPRQRVGIGYDSHRFAPGRPLVLGGIEIPHSAGLIGHSDADAVTHALIDALLGAAGAGDIGQLFPDTDPTWAGANSIELLRQAVKRVRAQGYQPVQADITVIAEAPQLGPHRTRMIAALAPVLGIEESAISIKAKTNEGMGWIGRGEGVAVLAVATVEAS